MAGALSRVVVERGTFDRVPTSRTLFLLETLSDRIHPRIARIFLTPFTEYPLHYQKIAHLLRVSEVFIATFGAFLTEIKAFFQSA
jgi:hypothetical protein